MREGARMRVKVRGGEGTDEAGMGAVVGEEEGSGEGVWARKRAGRERGSGQLLRLWRRERRRGAGGGEGFRFGGWRCRVGVWKWLPEGPSVPTAVVEEEAEKWVLV